MNCREAQKHLADYAAGFLQGALWQRMQEHVAECEDCRLHVQELRTLDRLVAADRVEAGEALVQGVMVRVRAAQVRQRHYWLYLLEGAGPIVAAAGLLPVAILVLWRLLEGWVEGVTLPELDLSLLAQPEMGTGILLGMAVVMMASVWLSYRLAEALT